MAGPRQQQLRVPRQLLLLASRSRLFPLPLLKILLTTALARPPPRSFINTMARLHATEGFTPADAGFKVGQCLMLATWGCFTFLFFIPTLRKNKCLMVVSNRPLLPALSCQLTCSARSSCIAVQ